MPTFANPSAVGEGRARSLCAIVAALLGMVLALGCAGEDEPGSPTLASITIAPLDAVINVGDTQAFVATGSYADGSTADVTAEVEWSSTNTDVATIDASGVATGIAVGTTQIAATMGALSSGLASLQVEEGGGDLVSITLEPTSATIDVGSTQPFVATGHYSDDTEGDISTAVEWASSEAAVATIDTTGVATGLQAGETDITATLSGVTSDPAALTVTDQPVPPSPGDLVINELLVDGTVEGDANGDGTIDGVEDAFVELVNVTGATLELSGVVIYETTFGIALPRHTFGSVELAPGEAVVVFGGGDAPVNIAGAQYFVADNQDPGLEYGLALDADGDTITVANANEDVVVSLEYGGSSGLDANIDQAINLDPDVTGSTYSPHDTITGAGGAIFSPGTLVDGSSFPN